MLSKVAAALRTVFDWKSEESMSKVSVPAVRAESIVPVLSAERVPFTVRFEPSRVVPPLQLEMSYQLHVEASSAVCFTDRSSAETTPAAANNSDAINSLFFMMVFRFILKALGTLPPSPEKSNIFLDFFASLNPLK